MPAIFSFSSVNADTYKTKAPSVGYIKDETIAIAYAKIILTSINGEEPVKAELPLTAKLKNGVWRVSGTLKPGLKGGVAEIEISKKDGRIIELSHGK